MAGNAVDSADGAELYVVFRIRDEHFAVAGDAVEEAVERPVLTPLPAVLGGLRGLIGRESDRVPVLDPSGLPAAGVNGDRASAAVILRRGRLRYALVVDEILGTRSGPGPRDTEHWVEGDRVISILDPESLFAGRLPSGWERREEMGIGQPAGRNRSFVVFAAGGEDFALPADAVEEIRTWERADRPEGAPDFIAGIGRIPGGSVPVVDLRRHLGLEEAEPDGESRLVLTGVAGHTVALLVDRVSDVAHMGVADVLETPGYLSRLVGPHLGGLLRTEADRLVVVLRGDMLFDSEQRRLLRAFLSENEEETSG